ncbi:MAG: restriction endonuclease subunit R, partial [Thermosynechococcus sp.]
YLYVPYHLFQQGAAAGIAELARACEPALQGLLKEWKTKQLALPLEEATAQSQEEALFNRALQEAGIAQPPGEVADVMRQAVLLLDHAIRSKHPTVAHAFQPLLGPLDEYAQRLLEKRLKSFIPTEKEASIAFFNPRLDHLPARERPLLEKHQRYLRDNLVFGRSIQRLGTLLFCLDYARQTGQNIPGLWQTVREQFGTPAFRELYEVLRGVNEFRNTRVAHVETPLTDEQEAWDAMRTWLTAMHKMAEMCK